jgi:hypothetical protein
MVYDTTRAAHGTRSMAITMGGTLGLAYTHWQVPGAGTVPKIWGRFYIYQTAIVANSTRIATLYNAAPTGTACLFIRLVTSTGKIELVGGGGTIWTSASALPLNQWVRVEFMCVGHATAGQAQMSYYSGDSTTATESSGTFTNQNTTGEIASVAWGISSNNSSLAKFWLDDMGSSLVAALGPALPQTGAMSVDITMKKMRLAVSGKGKTVVTGGPVLKKMKPAGTSTEKTSGSGGVRQRKMGVSGVITAKSLATGGVKLKKMKVAGTSTEKVAVSGGPGMKKMRLSGTGAGKTAVSVGIRMKKMRVAGTSTEKISASGGVRLKKMSVAGYQAPVSLVSGGVSLKKMRLAGTSTEKIKASGGVKQIKMRVSGSGTVQGGVAISVSGDIHLNKMRVHGSGAEEAELVSASQLFVFSPL